MSIIVLGTVALDTVKTPAGRRREMLGGSASHFSMSARLFTDVNLVAVIGEDFPKKHIDFLKRKGVILTSLIREKGETFRWEGEYKGDLNTALTLNTRLGVLSAFRPCVAECQKNIGNIFLANVDPDVQNRLLGMMKSPKLVGLDSMNFWIKHKRKSLLKLLKKVDLFVANDAEAKDLSCEDNIINAAKKLRSFGPKMVVVKKGEHGVIFYCDKFIFSLPGYPISKVVDPTGAGDTFAGGLMGYLVKSGEITESNIRKALAYATVMASFNVEDFGVNRAAKLTMKQVEARLKTFKKHMQF
ncbi:MAG: PfkB family carbohydrate kinase [Candidatus Omnitrophota bacterium]